MIAPNIPGGELLIEKKLKRRRWLLRLRKLLYLTGYLGFSFLALGVVGPLEGNTLGFLEFWGYVIGRNCNIWQFSNLI